MTIQNHSTPCVSYSIQGGELFISEKVLMELAHSILGRGVSIRFRFGSKSMLPFIRDSDILTLFPLGRAKPRLGEILAINSQESDRLIVHRLVGKRGADFLLRGDSRLNPDHLVSRENLLGRVMKVERAGKGVRLGLGPERFILAFFSRKGWLLPMVSFAKSVLKYFRFK